MRSVNAPSPSPTYQVPAQQPTKYLKHKYTEFLRVENTTIYTLPLLLLMLTCIFTAVKFTQKVICIALSLLPCVITEKKKSMQTNID
jgi:hypothetical protein